MQNKGHSTLDAGSAPATQADVLRVARDAITRIRAQGRAYSNVLATGDQGHSRVESLHNTAAAICVRNIATVAIKGGASAGQACSPHMQHLLNDPIWLSILERQGAPVLQELLSQCSVFVRARGRALLQISGPPLSDQTSLKRRRAPSAPQASGPAQDAPQPHKARALGTPTAAMDADGSAKAAPNGTHHAGTQKTSKDVFQNSHRSAKWGEGPLSARRKKLLRDAVAAIGNGDSSKVVKVKRCRPPSYKRRAAKQARMQATGALACTSTCTAPSNKLTVDVKLAGKSANVVEVPKRSIEPTTVAATATVDVAVCSKQTRGQAFKPAQCLLPRHSLFFTANFPSKPGLPASHPLSVASRAPDKTHNMKQLLVLIWGAKAPAPPSNLNCLSSCPCSSYAQSHGRGCAANSRIQGPEQPQVRLNFQQQILVSQTLKKMAEKASKLPWKALLDFHCPEPVLHPSECTKQSRLAIDCRTSKTHVLPNNTQDMPQMTQTSKGQPSQKYSGKKRKHLELPNSCPHMAVCGFLKAVLKRLVPKELLGSAHNKQLLCAWALRIACMGRFEDVSLHCVLQGMRTKDVHWLNAKHEEVQLPGGNELACQRREHAAKQQQMALLMWWLYGGVVMSVLRTFFFITDSQPLKGAAVFYRKPTWRCMESEAIQRLTGTMLEACPEGDIMTRLYHRELGAARLRHWPRMHGMRPIADLSRPTQLPLHNPPQPHSAPEGRKCHRPNTSTLAVVEEGSRPGAKGQPPGRRKQHSTAARKQTRKRKQCAECDVPGAPAAGQQGNVPPGTTITGAKRQIPVASSSYARGPVHMETRTGPIVLRPINKVLEPVHAALKTAAALQRQQSMVSSNGEQGVQEDSVSLTEAHKQLRRFHEAWRASGKPPLSMLAFDVSKAFDNVDAARVKDLLQQLVTSSGWKLHKLHSTVWARGALVTRYSTLAVPICAPSLQLPEVARVEENPQHALQTHRHHMHPTATTTGDFTALDALLSAVPAAGAPRVVTDTGIKSELSLQRFWNLLQHHLFENYVCLRSRWYRQRLGIPQGSITSPFLCNLYLSHLQRTLLSPLLRSPKVPEGLQASGACITQQPQHPLRLLEDVPHPLLHTAQQDHQQPSPEAHGLSQEDLQVDQDGPVLYRSLLEDADLIGSHPSPRPQCTLMELPPDTQLESQPSTQLESQSNTQLDEAMEHVGDTQPDDSTLPLPAPPESVSALSVAQHVSHTSPACPASEPTHPSSSPHQHVHNTSQVPFIHVEPDPVAPAAQGVPDPLLMRMADDFLLVSPAHAVAEAVCDACVHELPAHGVSVSADKMASNVSLQALHGAPSGATCSHATAKTEDAVNTGREWGVQGGHDGKQSRAKVPWCGLLVNSETLSVEVDYHRLHGMRVCDLINVGSTQPKALPDKMCLLLSVRLQPILLDVEMNGSDVVARNVHVAVAFATMKFHRFARALASKQLLNKLKSNEVGPKSNCKGGQVTADRSALRQACKNPTQLFKTILGPQKKAQKSSTSDSLPNPEASSAAVPDLLGTQSGGFKGSDADKLAAAVIGRVLPYAYSTCMRCNKHTDAALARSDLELLVLAGFMRVLQRRHAWYRCTLVWLQGCVRHPRLNHTRSRWATVIGDLNDLPQELRSLKW